MWKDIKLKYLFDLKGSLINRETKINMKKYKPGMTLKDINLLSIRKGENLWKFSLQDRTRLIDILENDVAILKTQKIMDYSLLLAVEKYQVRADRDRKGTQNITTNSNFSDDNLPLSKEKSMKARMSNTSSQTNMNHLTTCFVGSRHR